MSVSPGLADCDVVYVVRPTDANEALRFSLRTIAANLPHRRVWCAGYRPSWVSESVGQIATIQDGNRFTNSTRNLEAAASHPEVSDTFVYMNDDFFITEPVDTVPLAHRGRVRAFVAELRQRGIRGGGYLTGMEATLARLVELGYRDPLCYEVHLPMVMTKGRFLAALDTAWGVKPLHKRTLYGNLYHDPADAVEIDDPKIGFAQAPSDMPAPFVSTAPKAWNGIAGQRIRRAFAQPGPYETAARRRARRVATAG